MKALNQYPIYDAVFSHDQIHASKNQGMEMGVASLNISPSDPLAKGLPSDPTTLCSADLVVLVPKGGMFS